MSVFKTIAHLLLNMTKIRNACQRDSVICGTDNDGLDSQTFSQTSLCLLLSFLVCKIIFDKAAQSKQSQPHFTGPRQALLRASLARHLRHSQVLSLGACTIFTQNPRTRLHTYSTTPAQLYHLRAASAHSTPTRLRLRSYKTFWPQVRTTNTNERHAVFRPSLFIDGAGRHLTRIPWQLRRLPAGYSRVALASGVYSL